MIINILFLADSLLDCKTKCEQAEKQRNESEDGRIQFEKENVELKHRIRQLKYEIESVTKEREREHCDNDKLLHL